MDVRPPPSMRCGRPDRPMTTAVGATSTLRRMGEFIRYETDGKIGTVTIDRPQKKNAMTYAMLGDFIETIAQADADESTSVIVVTGVPGAFCAGTDLSDLASVPGEQRGLRGGADETRRWWPITQTSKPTICAVDGPAVGHGRRVHVAVRPAHRHHERPLRLELRHRGLVPDTGAGTWLLPRIIGMQQALKLLYTGEIIDAAAALELGYVLEVVAPDELTGRVRALAEQVAGGSPHSQRYIKQLVHQGLTAPVSEHMQRHTEAMTACFKSDDHREGVASFLERRPAVFTGR